MMRLEQRKDKVKSAIQELADRLLNMELTAEELVIVTEALYVGTKERLRKESDELVNEWCRLYREISQAMRDNHEESR